MLLITIDTLRADHLHCYGYQHIQTPNIDALARQGVRFSQAFSAVPITLPSHTVILTGMYPMATGMHDFSDNRLSPRIPTMASLLGEAGYTTGAVVASAVLDSRFGLNQGFDFYYDHFNFDRLQAANLDRMSRPGNVVVNIGLDWLAKNDRKPFFLWIHLYDAHSPYHPPPPYSTEYKTHPYDGGIAFDDAQVGRLMNFLKQKGLWGNTLIVLAADHGEGLGQHGEKTHGFFIYDSTLHVPLIIKAPSEAKIKPRVVSADVSLADIFPTVLGILHVPAPPKVEGKDLLPLMEGKHNQIPESLYAETYLPLLHFDWSELRSIQDAQYHYIDAPKPELYDLRTDPKELHNLYATKRLLAKRYQMRLASLIHEYTPPSHNAVAERVGLDPALMERLESLGYAAVPGGGDSSLTNRNLPDPKDRLQMYDLISDAIADSQDGHYQASIEKLRRTFTTEKDSEPVHYLLGLDYYHLQNYEESVKEFRWVVKASPNYALAEFYLGLAYVRNGNVAEAIPVFEQTLRLDSTNFTAAYDLGACYLKTGRVAEAISSFEKAVQIYPQDAEAYRALGEVYLYQKRTDDAIGALEKAVSLNPSDVKSKRLLEKARSQKTAGSSQ